MGLRRVKSTSIINWQMCSNQARTFLSVTILVSIVASPACAVTTTTVCRVAGSRHHRIAVAPALHTTRRAAIAAADTAAATVGTSDNGDDSAVCILAPAISHRCFSAKCSGGRHCSKGGRRVVCVLRWHKAHAHDALVSEAGARLDVWRRRRRLAASVTGHATVAAIITAAAAAVAASGAEPWVGAAGGAAVLGIALHGHRCRCRCLATAAATAAAAAA
jgi:hypothetical protein